MDEKVCKQNEEVEIDLKRLFDAVWNRIWIVVLVTVLTGALAFVGTLLFITPKYQSSAMFYVNNGSLSIGNASLSLSAGDISASRGLVDTYIVILQTRETLVDVIDYSGVDITVGELRGMITAAAVDDTEIFRVTVTHPDPETAEVLANAVAHILPKRIDRIIESTSAQVVDTAIVPTAPSSPDYTKNAVIGLLAGLLVTVVIIVLRDLFDTSIRVEEDIQRVCPHPVLSAVPDMLAPSKGGKYRRRRYGYGYGKKNAAAENDAPTLIGEGISFAASEAYKLLRTKLQYSFADEKNSRVIGVSSALTAEGKSLTAVNLAYSLSQLDKKVLLIDCDMRRPSISIKLPVEKYPGLSGYLARQNDLEELIQHCGIQDHEKAFHVIAAGQNPPNPIELLSSARMEKLLNILRERYDYILLDLPPVSEVSDALAMAKETDGILLVVRQHYCDRMVLSAAVHQFAFVDSRVLGVVYNCTTEDSKGYGTGYYKRYYRKHYGRYGRKYEGSYAKKTEKEAK